MRTILSLTIASLITCLLASPLAFGLQPSALSLQPFALGLPPSASPPTWVGIQLEPVPPPLASQLKLSEGLMVRNVFVDSPGDKAGLRQYDVLVEADGMAIRSDVHAFARAVQGKSAGDSLTLVLYREGQRMEAEVRLETQPHDWAARGLKYEEPPLGVPGLHGRILRRGPDGWRMEDLGPLPPGGGWSGRLQEYVDQLFTEGQDEPTECRRVHKDGSVLRIILNPDGTVVVKRYQDQDGERSAEVKTYGNVEELKADDPEAHRLLESSRKEREILRRPGSQGRWTWPPKLPKPGDSGSWDELDKSLDEWREQIDEFRKQTRKWRAEAEEAIREGRWDERWREWYDRFFQGPLGESSLPEPPASSGPPAAEDSTVQPEGGAAVDPPVRFETHPDGRITVHLRQGDAELSQTYESEDQFRQAAPQLHESYRRLRETLLR